MKKRGKITESEAVSDAIADIHARDQLHQVRFAKLRAKVMVGIEELDRSEGAEWNIEDIQAGGRALLASRKATV